jgi:ketosteroid isomerase-like protein
MSPDKSTTDPVELTRRSFEAGSRRDIDAAMSNYGSDSVWDMSAMGLGSYRGVAAIRSFFEDWIGAYDEFEMDLRECAHLGNGVVFFAVRQTGRPVGSTGQVELNYAGFTVWVDGVAARVSNYADVDEARAAAERLAARATS